VKENSVLVIGCGNPARGDDGLAPAFVERLDQLRLPGVETRNQYQLCVEDAMDMSGYGQVVYVDASLVAPPPFDFSPLPDDAVMHLDTHSISPAALTYLARTLFGATAGIFVLAIRGYRFDPFTETISERAQGNLREAITWFMERYNGWSETSGKIT
jgi:hydrogenase maturation protease